MKHGKSDKESFRRGLLLSSHKHARQGVAFERASMARTLSRFFLCGDRYNFVCGLKAALARKRARTRNRIENEASVSISVRTGDETRPTPTR
jgi:hypothetical protein